ncbi:MAG: HAMP domain-containing histidine kinase, partial [Elusimicrobia bacterium]|nr:HAMP domain-containing histidine kinase [Elusimicrobiota bacterium]
GDSTLKGKHASSPHELAAVERRVPLRQDGVGGDDRRVYSAPAFKGKEFAGTALVSFRRADLERALDWIRDLERRRRWLALLLGASLALLGGLAISSWLLRPLGGLLEAARRVRAGDFAHRVEHPSSDELGVLAGEFNAMTARLGELDQLKADFVAQVTHDLRSPLSGILAQADILSGGYKGKLTEDQLECLRLLDRSGRDLAALVDNILDVTRLEAGETKLEPAPLDIRDAIEPMLDGFKARAEKLGVGLEAHIQPELSLVMADPEALRRVLENLLSNALKFTPKDGHVSVSARRDTPRECVVTVSDSGPGIPDFRMAQLFKKFSQIPETQSLSRGHAGSGLGLAICRKLVERMGGRIWAESEPGKGARFRFTLPLVLAREGGAYSK